jgi:threonyl-tRNA synthetase
MSSAQPDPSLVDVSYIRHSLAHLLAAAVLEKFPDAKLGIGPAIENGFYYDIQFPTTGLSPDDLPALADRMRDMIRENLPITGRTVSAEEARQLFANQPFKQELIDEFSTAGQTLTVYATGDSFFDLCRGGHVEHTGAIATDGFTLDRLAGAYWRGDEKNPQLTRIYGLAFSNKQELDAFLQARTEAEKRDHRTLGEKLNLFHFDESIGKGLPIWLPHGNIIKETLEQWAKETEEAWGYQRITTPIITKENLFYTSGHLPLYKDSMYAPIVIEDENYYIKPMNCPFHHKTFAARPKSYRDLPVRFAEYGWCHRYEDSGSLFGLMRVRGMQMNDAHIYVQKERAIEEFVRVIQLHEYYYQKLGITNYQMELALRDPSNMGKYHGNEADWKEAEEMTIEAMKQSKVPYTIVHEGAAFYGPKMDFQIYSSIGRSFTASTNQLDLFMGKQFGLEYTDADGKRKTPVVIHRAPLGTHERFIGFLIEHFAGAFPVWLSPVQVHVIPVSATFSTYAQNISDQLRRARVRVEIQPADETLGKRIRIAQEQKIPYILVVGEKEQTAGTVSARHYRTGQMDPMPLSHFIDILTRDISEKIL